MSSFTVSRRQRPGFIAWFLAMQPSILLGASAYAILNFDMFKPLPKEFVGASGVTASIMTVIIALFARMGNATHWIVFVLVMALTTILTALSIYFSNPYLFSIIFGMDSVYLAGMLHGSPGLIVSPFVIWVLHKLAGRSSPWALDEE